MTRKSNVMWMVVCAVMTWISSASSVTGQTLPASTFFGGSDSDLINDLTTDAQGNIYVVGYTSSPDLPMLPDSWDTTFSAVSDVFVAKFDADLTELLAATYLGGNDSDHAYRVRVDRDGCILVSGFTESADLLVTDGAYNHPGVGVGGFLARFDADLTTMLGLARIGGSGSDFGYSLAEDMAGNIYIAGETESYDLPVTSGVYATEHVVGNSGDTDFFISCFSADLSTLLASTYLGGRGIEIHSDLALNADGDVVLLGASSSSNFPTTVGAWDRVYGGDVDVVVAILSPDLAALQSATFVGASSYDRPWDMDFGIDGVIYFTGYSESYSYPTTPLAFDRSYHGPIEAFVSCLSADLSTLVASTLLGGYGTEYGVGVAVQADGKILAGTICDRATFRIMPGAMDPSFNGGLDFALASLDPSLQSLSMSTYLGGSGNEWGGVWADDRGGIFAAGSTSSVDLPISPYACFPDYVETPSPGNGDAFVGRLSGLSVSSAPTPGTRSNSHLPWQIESVTPNPFNPRTVVRFSIDEASRLSIDVYDAAGRHVRRLADGPFAEGRHSVTWDGKDDQGQPLSSGVYLVGVRGDGAFPQRGSARAKMLLVR
jgi:FlgD Ig-like domain/Beta-propeller repeat